MNIAVIGGGSWATAIIKILSEKKSIKIKWWLRSTSSVNHIKKYHHNPNYLQSVEIHPSKIKPVSKISAAFKGADVVIIAIPSAFVKNSIQSLKADDFAGKIIVSAVKGIIPEEHLIITDYLIKKFDVEKEFVTLVGGPCHAEEVAKEMMSYLTVAGDNTSNTSRVADLFSTRFTSAQISNDLIGIEYAAIMKNIVAIANGICQGLGAGDNFEAVLVANSINEIRVFLNAIDPKERNICDSPYLGDLLVTAYSKHSRNRNFGHMLGKGYTVKAAQLEMNMIAEGYYAVKSIIEINKAYNCYLPICNFVYNIIYTNKPAKREYEILKKELR